MILRFGKWRGHSIETVEIAYILWLLGQRWFRDTCPELYPVARRRAADHFAAEVARERQPTFEDLV